MPWPVPWPCSWFCSLAVCSMLGWRKTDRAEFARPYARPRHRRRGGVQSRSWRTSHWCWSPSITRSSRPAGRRARRLPSRAPRCTTSSLTVLAFASAALLFTSSLYLLGRGVRVAACVPKGEGHAASRWSISFRRSPAQAGGYLCHLGVAIVVVGLVGSMMYVREATVNLAGEAGESVRVGAYELRVHGQRALFRSIRTTEIMRVDLDVTNAETGRPLGHVAPSMKVAAATSQTTLDAAVITFPLEDLFVAFQGLNPDGSLSLNVKRELAHPVHVGGWRDFHVGHRARVRAPPRHAAFGSRRARACGRILCRG
ncbi:MAG: cytochrome c-type biogenesis CcmF C-terminal domain-containing protein [Collinsella sp.]